MFVRMCIAVLVSLAWASVSMAEIVPGKNYNILRPAQPTESPGKVEVIQFFSYGCPHCTEMHGMVSAWKAKLPKDVVFKRVPVTFGRPQWANLAKLYYALEATGDLERLDDAVYEAMENGVPMNTEQDIILWVRARGVDPQKFTREFKGFDVANKALRANVMAQEYDIDGVPSFAVNGKYLAVGKTYQELLDVTNELIALSRKEGDTSNKAAGGENPASPQRASPVIRLVQ